MPVTGWASMAEKDQMRISTESSLLQTADVSPFSLPHRKIGNRPWFPDIYNSEEKRFSNE
jgi:hypothetical protein